MPESFESLIPAKPEPKFKYAAEGAGKIKSQICASSINKEKEPVRLMYLILCVDKYELIILIIILAP